MYTFSFIVGNINIPKSVNCIHSATKVMAVLELCMGEPQRPCLNAQTLNAATGLLNILGLHLHEGPNSFGAVLGLHSN